jgi:serine/threonine protein kinase
MSSFNPEVFGKYYLVDKIAVGGMAEIFKAKTFSHGGFEKLLVIKRILSHLSENEDFVSMFIDEAKISVSLQHANIVQIYDFGKLQENYFIAMEWIDGKDVKQMLRKLASRRKLLPEEFAVYIAHEACKALDFAHHKTDLAGRPMGIIHRDVSPSNILVSYEGEVKIADFGIAKAQFSAYNTKDGVLKGKFEYMSPEQARGEDLTPRSDIFAAGIILYEMLTGRRLFKTESELKTLEKVKAVDIQPPSALNPNVPPRLDALVMRALTKDPEERYRDAGEFQGALLEYMYPSTPTVTQKSLSLFMKEVFTEERKGELERLEAGSEAARSLHSKVPDLYLDDGWEEGPSSSAPSVPSPDASNATLYTEPASRSPLLLTVLVGLFVITIAAFYVLSQDPGEPAPPPPVETPAATTGVLRITVSPGEARVFDGEDELGGGPELTVELEPGDHTLRVEAEGWQPQEYPIAIVAGERVVIPVKLLPEEDEGGDDARDPAPDKPEERIEAPKPEQPKQPDRPAPVADGQVNINVSGGWAYIYVDGQKLAETTPLSGYALPAGPHVVRVVNEALGLDKSQTVNVPAGDVAKVFFGID